MVFLFGYINLCCIMNREYATDKKKRFKPVIISHHMLMGMKEGQEKMSKSDPDSAIFMEDSEEDVRRKVKKAFCPPEVIEGNPVLDYTKHLIFGYYGRITVTTSADGAIEYTDYALLEADFVSGKIHPSDLKPAVAEALNRILEPVRIHFAQGEPKALLDKIKKFKVTR
jgi:tyrosyl-tRNA synthetase